MKTFAFIFARGVLKGFQKNILNLGLPLTHSILSAKNNQMIDDVFVSTDSDEIAEVSNKFEAKIIKRPKNLHKMILQNGYLGITQSIMFMIKGMFLTGL